MPERRRQSPTAQLGAAGVAETSPPVVTSYRSCATPSWAGWRSGSPTADELRWREKLTRCSRCTIFISNATPGELVGIDEVLKEAGVSRPPKVNRVVLVGNKISPGNPVTKADGTVVRALWGELAWQLGFVAGGIKEAKKAYKRIEADDEKATSPGDVLRELMNDYAPCLILTVYKRGKGRKRSENAGAGNR